VSSGTLQDDQLNVGDLYGPSQPRRRPSLPDEFHAASPGSHLRGAGGGCGARVADDGLSLLSSQRALLAATFPQLEGGSLLGDHPPADVRVRVALFAEKMTESILANEAEMRAMLRLSLDPQVPLHEVALRQGRRTMWVAVRLPRSGTR